MSSQSKLQLRRKRRNEILQVCYLLKLIKNSLEVHSLIHSFIQFDHSHYDTCACAPELEAILNYVAIKLLSF